MAVVSGSPAPFNPGFELIDGTALNVALARGIGFSSYASGLVAVGTTAPTGLQLNAVVNKFATVASGTGANLPQAIAGATCLVDVRAGANTMAIYSSQTSTTDTIDGTAGTTGTTLTQAHGAALFVCYTAGAWVSYLMGAVSS